MDIIFKTLFLNETPLQLRLQTHESMHTKREINAQNSRRWELDTTRSNK